MAQNSVSPNNNRNIICTTKLKQNTSLGKGEIQGLFEISQDPSSIFSRPTDTRNILPYHD